eukprot:m.22836 g.22836  ORF g.22836 m.22836 type:complete len:294 (-) comp5871_c0_seq1:2168-3049(-)
MSMLEPPADTDEAASERASASRSGPASEHCVDSHSHGVGDIPKTGLGVKWSVLMSVDETEWAAVEKRAEDARWVPCFGVHPWNAHLVSEGWVDRLTDILARWPHACVGEIGLDKVARTPETNKCEYGIQKEVFGVQLGLAGSLGRAASLHCVRAIGTVFDAIEELVQKEAAPPVIVMHSFTGSPDFIERLLKLKGTRVYFGFSAAVNLADAKRRSHLRESLSKIPSDRLLAESDLAETEAVKDAVEEIVTTMAEILGVEFSIVAAWTSENCHHAFKTVTSQGNVKEGRIAVEN